MKAINGVYKLKEDKTSGLPYGPPNIYLGLKVQKYCNPESEDDTYCWSLSGDDYVKNIVANVQKKLQADGRQLNAKQSSPLTIGYRPELDVSQELSGDSWSWYNQLIGELRWAIELGRADIATEVSLMSRHLALPRRRHLDQVLCFKETHLLAIIQAYLMFSELISEA